MGPKAACDARDPGSPPQPHGPARHHWCAAKYGPISSTWSCSVNLVKKPCCWAKRFRCSSDSPLLRMKPHSANEVWLPDRLPSWSTWGTLICTDERSRANQAQRGRALARHVEVHVLASGVDHDCLLGKASGPH